MRPTCTACDKPAAKVRNNKMGKPIYRKYKDMPGEGWCCYKCHCDKIARRHGVSSAIELTAKRNGKTVAEYRHDQLEARAAELGMTVYEYRVKCSKYLWYREEVNYCENIDGRLGFTCTTTVVTLPSIWNGMLDVDHKDGNHRHNDRTNLQTLCKCCHAFKSWKSKDYATPGRKTRGKEAMVNV